MSLIPEKDLSQRPERKQIFKRIRDFNSLLRKGFYFSHNYNLMRSYEFQKLEEVNHFAWNGRMIHELQSKRQLEWVTVLIQGYISSFSTFIEGIKLNYVLISRRSAIKGGTRYFDRGIDEEGNAANFVETEQIINIGDYIVSDMQIRGNVPLFFEQKGLTTQVKLTRGYELTH